MTHQERIRIFDSQGQAYRQAFKIFLDHRPKTNANSGFKPWSKDCQHATCLSTQGPEIEGLRRRLLVPLRALAIEPNVYLREQLDGGSRSRGHWPTDLLAAHPAAQGTRPLLAYVLLHSSRGVGRELISNGCVFSMAPTGGPLSCAASGESETSEHACVTFSATGSNRAGPPTLSGPSDGRPL